MKVEIKNLFARSTTTRKFFNFGVVTNDAVEVMLYGVIGWEVDADDFVSQLKAVTAKTINLSINSVGGDVFDGTAIYNALKAHPAKKIVSIDGIAASAASLIAMAGDQINIGKNAYLMIHRASAMAFGNGDDLRQTADVMDKVDKAIAGTYADQTGKLVADISALMQAETWMVGQEAVDAGFCDSVTDREYTEEETDGDDADDQVSAVSRSIQPPTRTIATGGDRQAQARGAIARAGGCQHRNTHATADEPRRVLGLAPGDSRPMD